MAFKTWIKYAEFVIEKKKACEKDGVDYFSEPTESSASDYSSDSESEEDESSFESSYVSEDQDSYAESQREGRDSVGSRDELSTSRVMRPKLVENTLEEFNEESKDRIEDPILASTTSRNDMSSNKLLVSRRTDRRCLNNESFGVFEQGDAAANDIDNQTENRLDTIHSSQIKVTQRNQEVSNDEEQSDKHSRFGISDVEDLINEASFRHETSFRRRSLMRRTSVGLRNGVINVTINNQIIIQNNIFLNNIQPPRDESSTKQRQNANNTPK